MLIFIGGRRHGALHSPSKIEHVILNNIYADMMQDKFYLPGDIKKCMPGYDAYKFESAMKKIRNLANNNQSKFEVMARELSSKIEYSIKIGLLKESIKKDEERQDQMDAFQYAMGMLANQSKPSKLEELADSLKKSIIGECLAKKAKPLPRATKCVKASNVNRKVNKIIYHHVRSNC
jgi:hypothetical protein